MHNLPSIKQEVYQAQKSLDRFIELYAVKCRQVDRLERDLRAVVNSKVVDLKCSESPPEWLDKYWEDRVNLAKLQDQIAEVNMLLFRHGFPMIAVFQENDLVKKVDLLLTTIEELRNGNG